MAKTVLKFGELASVGKICPHCGQYKYYTAITEKEAKKGLNAAIKHCPYNNNKPEGE